MGRRGEAEYQFTIVHLTVLAVCVLATSSVVFLLGFYVGRESAALHSPIDERVARLPSRDDSPPVKTTVAVPSVNPSPTPAPPPPVGGRPVVPPPATGAVMPYTVQVVATRDRGEAESVRAQLIKRSIGAYISEVEDANGRWYRVRIGRYDELSAARSMESRLRRDLGLSQATIVPAATDSR